MINVHRTSLYLLQMVAVRDEGLELAVSAMQSEWRESSQARGGCRNAASSRDEDEPMQIRGGKDRRATRMAK